MWRPPRITHDNLRQIIREAPAGVEIPISGGEYEGPFIFDRPIRLVGQGNVPERVTLWTRRGPAVIVRSTNVYLANLSVELTFEEAQQNNDAALWHAKRCRPDTQSARIQGRIKQMGKPKSSDGWNLPDLIDLGDLRARCPITLPMVIQVPGPAQLSGLMSSLKIEPGRLPAGGQYLIHVHFPKNKLFKDTMLAGQLIINSEGESRAVWIIGRVLDDEFKAWIRDKIILVGQGGHKYGFETTMLLGTKQFQGEPGAEHLADKQAYISKEVSGAWSIIQPLPVVRPTRVNDQPLDVGRRQLLRGGETIEVGSFKLTVEGQKTNLQVLVDGNVDFGKLSAVRSGSTTPAIKVQNNHNRKIWEGTIRAISPWIQVSQPQVSCPGGQTVRLPVQLGPNVNSLPRQTKLVEYGALALKSPTETLFVNAQLEVDIREGLEVEPDILDFGQVSRPDVITAKQLRLRNVGSVDWQGTVQAVPWLVVDNSAPQCAAGAETILEVRLTDQVINLPEGPNAVSEALIIEGQNLKVTVAARLDFDKPKVQLVTQPRRLDWGKITDWRTAPIKTVKLMNTGTKDWQGQIKSKVPWLKIVPKKLTCSARGHSTVEIRLTDQFQNLADGEHNVSEAVEIETEAVFLSARLVVEVPLIQPDKSIVDLVLGGDPNLRQSTLRVRNNGKQPWRGNIESTLPWLVVRPTDVTCPAGDEVVIDIALELSQINRYFTKPRPVKVEDAIRLKVGAQPILVGVRLDIKSLVDAPPSPLPPPPIDDDTEKDRSSLLVDFGAVSDWSGTLPNQEVRLTNSQPWVMKGTVSSTLPWLEVTPTEFSCPPGKEMVLTVGLTKNARHLRPKVYDIADALIIESSGKKHLVNVRLKITATLKVKPSPRPSSEKPVSPSPRLSVDFGTISDWSERLPTREVRLKNSQTEEMKGAVQSTLPWIEVTPTEFSCPPGKEVKLTVQLTRSAANLRPKLYDVSDAVIIKSNNKKHLIKARLNVERTSPGSEHLRPFSFPLPKEETPASPTPSSAITISPATGVDFGQITGWSGVLPEREIRLVNSSQQVIEGVVRSTLPWLEVTPTSFSCSAKQDVSLTVKLTRSAASLRPKTYDVADALIVESGPKKFRVRARLDIPLNEKSISFPPIAKPLLAKTSGGKKVKGAVSISSFKQGDEPYQLKPSSLDFGAVKDWKRPLPTQEIEFTNATKRDWQGTVRSTLPWLEVKPTKIICPAGATVKLQVCLTSHGARLRPRTYSAPDALIVEGDSQELLVGASLTVSQF